MPFEITPAWAASLTIKPSGKKRIFETPAHGVLQLFAAQNFTIFQKFERLTHGTGRHAISLRHRLRGQRRSVFLHRRRKYSLLNGRQPIPDREIERTIPLD